VADFDKKWHSATGASDNDDDDDDEDEGEHGYEEEKKADYSFIHNDAAPVAV
jgi:hypothetical protein